MTLATAYSRLFDIPAENDNSTFYRHHFLTLCVFYLAIASMLAVVVRYGVMDEDFHLASSRPFGTSGLNRITLYNHIPPTGVASHLWYALWVWLFPGINYIGLRLINCTAIALVVGLAYLPLKSVSISGQKKVLAASCFLVVSPYFFLSISTVMTEGPALLFLFAGLLLLYISRLQHLFPFLLACLLLGLATIARFYFIPLLPALFVVLIVSDWQQYRQYGLEGIKSHRAFLYLFIGIGLLPLVGLILLWGGLTPPSFNQWSELRSGVSFNSIRPVVALAMIGVYIAPIVVVNVDLGSKSLLRILSGTVTGALFLALMRINIFHTTSINSVVSGPIEHGLEWLKLEGNLALRLGLFTTYSLSFFSLALVFQRIIHVLCAKNLVDSGFLFSIFFVLLFVLSQAFVGGNQPLYERYLIHPWPFIGYIVVTLFPEFLNPRTFLVLSGYTILFVLVLIKWGI